MIKKSVYVLLSITLVFILVGCKKDEVVSNSSNLVLSGTDLAISDPEIKKEIEFMLSEKMIDDATYNKWQTLSRDQLIFTGGLPKTLSTGIVEKSEQYLYNYPDCPNCSDGVAIERRDLKEMME